MVLSFYLFSLKSFSTSPWVTAKCPCSSVKAGQVLTQLIRLDTVRQLEVLKGLDSPGSGPGSGVLALDTPILGCPPETGHHGWGGEGKQQFCFPGEAPMPPAPQAHSPRGQHGAERGGFPASLSRLVVTGSITATSSCVWPWPPPTLRLQRHSPWLLTTATCFTPCFPGIWPLRAAPCPALPCILLPGPVLAGNGGRGAGGKVSAAAHGLRRPPPLPRGPGVRLPPRRAAGRAHSPQPDPISKECACRVRVLEESWGFKAWLTEHAWDRQDPGQMWPECPGGGCPAPGPQEGHQPCHS